MERISLDAMETILPQLPDRVFICFPEVDSDPLVIRFQKLTGEVQRINKRLVGYRIMHCDLRVPLSMGMEGTWHEAMKRVLLCMEASSILEQTKKYAYG